MGLQEDYDSLKRVHDSVNKRVIQLEIETASLKDRNSLLVAEKNQWEQSKVMNNEIIAGHIGINDKKIHDLENEIISLKNEIKILKGK